MKQMFRLAGISTLILLTVGTLFAVIIKDKPIARSNGSDITISWITVDETGVQKFEILRRAGWTGDFLVIGEVVQLKGGNNSVYEFIDKSAFKTSGSIYQYKVRVINGQNPAPETEIVTVSHVSSTAKRTWGSIKAMFR